MLEAGFYMITMTGMWFKLNADSRMQAEVKAQRYARSNNLMCIEVMHI